MSAIIDMPETARKAADQFTAQLWTSLNKLTSGTINNVRRECEEQVQLLEAERDEAYREIERLESSITTLESSLSTSEQELDSANSELRNLLEQIRTLDVDREKATGQAQAFKESLQTVQTHLEETQELNTKLQAKLISLAEGAKEK